MDYFSLKAAVEEAGSRFPGRKIREAGQASAGTAFLSFGKGDSILLSISPDRPGLFLPADESFFDPLPSPFSEALSAHVKGSTLASISMPEAGERIVFLNFLAGWPEKAGSGASLVLEVMGRHSNLAVLEGERILQPMKPVPPEKSRRPFLPGGIWAPPPPRAGLPPEEVRPGYLAGPGEPWPPDPATLQGKVRGLSPFAARQALKDAGQGGPDAIVGSIRRMLDSADGERGWLFSSEEGTWLCPFEPRLFGEGAEKVTPYAPFSAASAAWRETDKKVSRQEQGSNALLLEKTEKVKARLESTLSLLEAEMVRCSSHEEVRRKAQALLVNASRISRGTSSVSLPDPVQPERTFSISLDPSLSPSKNADRLFREAGRLKRGLEGIPERRALVEKELRSVASARAALSEGGDPAPALAILHPAHPEPARGREPGFRAHKGPGKKFTFEGFVILVGRNAADNEKVTFKTGHPEDPWLHARDGAGSHVVILAGKRAVPEEVFLRAAALAARNSEVRNDSAPEVMVSKRKWVRKLKGARPGMVTVERYRTLRVRMQERGGNR